MMHINTTMRQLELSTSAPTSFVKGNIPMIFGLTSALQHDTICPQGLVCMVMLDFSFRRNPVRCSSSGTHYISEEFIKDHVKGGSQLRCCGL